MKCAWLAQIMDTATKLNLLEKALHLLREREREYITHI